MKHARQTRGSSAASEGIEQPLIHDVSSRRRRNGAMEVRRNARALVLLTRREYMSRACWRMAYRAWPFAANPWPPVPADIPPAATHDLDHSLLTSEDGAEMTVAAVDCHFTR